jgi:hypothetical protein
MSMLVNYLQELNLLTHEDLHKYIINSRIEEINNLVLYLRQIINEEYMLHDYSPFTFVPNDDISGTGGCIQLSCKIERATNFAIFSALYADRVYIQLDFITSEHYKPQNIQKIEANEKKSNRYKKLVEIDLALIITYSELIKKNIVYITPVHQTLCPNCFQKMIFGTSNTINIDNLQKQYCNKAMLKLDMIDIEHCKAMVTIENIPEFFSGHPLVRVFNDMDTIKLLSKEIVGDKITNKDFSDRIINRFVHEELVRICYTTKYSQDLNARLITNKLSDSMFLRMNNEHENLQCLENYEELLPKYAIPLINKLNIKDIIHLREEEQESFNKYRMALNNAAVEQIKVGNKLDQRKIYDDIIYPELNNLNMKLKQLKQGRLSKIFETMIVVGTVVTANRFGDIIGSSLQTIGTMFGLAVGAARTHFLLENENNKKADLQNNDFFFLWKLKQRIKNHC